MNIFSWIRSHTEAIIHLFFWLFILSAINIDWTANWFDEKSRPNTPAPLSLIIFAIYFYINAFFLIPKYFSRSSWKKYMLYALIVFVGPELIRIAYYMFAITDLGFERTLFSRDSFLFGAPSPFFFGLNTSFIYKLMKHWLFNEINIQSLNEMAKVKKSTLAYEDSILLSEEESCRLQKDLKQKLEIDELYLNPNLTLRDLAEAIGITEKKLSYLLNQSLGTSYYELINHYRVEKFKSEVKKEENQSLSLVGIAFNCGFPSKSSFYRAFKSMVSLSPSEYIKEINKGQ